MIQMLILQCIIMLSQKIVKGSELEFILYTVLCLGGLIANFFHIFPFTIHITHYKLITLKLQSTTSKDYYVM